MVYSFENTDEYGFYLFFGKYRDTFSHTAVMLAVV
tara:strand:+ start:48 stop:152 length:105 start_codon:yes stop_codon:yes gene_type:complete